MPHVWLDHEQILNPGYCRGLAYELVRYLPPPWRLDTNGGLAVTEETARAMVHNGIALAEAPGPTLREFWLHLRYAFRQAVRTGFDGWPIGAAEHNVAAARGVPLASPGGEHPHRIRGASADGQLTVDVCSGRSEPYHAITLTFRDGSGTRVSLAVRPNDPAVYLRGEPDFLALPSLGEFGCVLDTAVRLHPAIFAPCVLEVAARHFHNDVEQRLAFAARETGLLPQAGAAHASIPGRETSPARTDNLRRGTIAAKVAIPLGAVKGGCRPGALSPGPVAAATVAAAAGSWISLAPPPPATAAGAARSTPAGAGVAATGCAPGR